MDSVIVENIGKSYKEYSNRWYRLLEWVVPKINSLHKTKWVLRNISFSVKKGEAVGIVGINGAGKSTLLKIITGTTQPSSGTVRVKGRVAALLELGMGFHPEFTGRQNAIMSGQLLGYSAEEIDSLMGQIEAFAEIGHYIDLPVRVYSSGMQVRLAFSVATAIRPDLLIVDEALSVGDVYFQQKCIERIEKYKAEGTSILFVTHDFSALHTICDRAVLLAEGECKYIGKTIEVVERYYGYLNKNKAINQEEQYADIGQKYVPISKFISKLSFINNNNEEVKCFESGVLCTICVEMIGLEEYNPAHIGFRIQDRLGQVIYETNTYCQRINVPHLGRNTFLVKFINVLAPGEYTFAMGIESEGHGDGLFNKVISLTERVGMFQVIDSPNMNKWAGMYNITPQIKLL